MLLMQQHAPTASSKMTVLWALYSIVVIVVMLGSSFPRIWEVIAGPERVYNSASTTEFTAVMLILSVAAVRGVSVVAQTIRLSTIPAAVIVLCPVVLAVSTLWSPLPSRTFAQAIGLLIWVLAGLGLWSELETYVWGWHLLSCAAAVPLVWSWINIRGLKPGAVQSGGRWVGLFASANHLASLAAVSTICLAAALHIGLRVAYRRWWLSLWTIALIPIGALALVTTFRTLNSTVRIALLGIVVLFVAGVLAKTAQRLNTRTGGWSTRMVAFVAVVTVSVGLVWLVNNRSKLANWDFNGRREIFGASIDGIKQEPWLGWGFQAPWFAEEFRTTIDPELLIHGFSHNMWLDVAMGTGAVVGAVFTLVTIFLTVMLMRSTWKHPALFPALAVWLLILAYLSMEPLTSNNWYLYATLAVIAVHVTNYNLRSREGPALSAVRR